MLDYQQLNNKLSMEIWKSNLFVVVCKIFHIVPQRYFRLCSNCQFH